MLLTLSNAALQAEAETHGGELVSLRDQAGTEYIWQGDPAFWTGRNPVLFPIVGNLKDGQVDINGKICKMGRHGFARQSEFSVAEQGKDFVVLELRESPETLACYPFPFILQIRHQLLENGFSTSFTVKNPGEKAMPFCIGAHTAIRCPLSEGERFEDYELAFDQKENADTMLLGPDGLTHPGETEPMMHDGRVVLDYDTFRRLDTIIFENLQSKNVALRHKETGRGVSLDFQQFPMVAFWTKPGGPFLCMEPWRGCAAAWNESGKFLDKPWVTELAPGDRCELGYSFTLLGN